MLCSLDKIEFNTAAELYAKAYNVNIIAAQAVVESFANVVLAQKDDVGISAILCATKFNLSNSTAVLLHGIACRDGLQQGLAQSLVQHAKSTITADNYIVIALDEMLPYSLDMSNKIVARMLNCDIKRNLWAKADFDIITAKKLCKYREKYVSEPYVQLTVEQAAALLTSLYSQGITSAETSKAYALYFRTKDKLVVVELYAQNDVDAWFLLEAMADRESRSNAQIILSENNTVFAGEGKRFNYASYTNAQIENNNIYIGPMPK